MIRQFDLLLQSAVRSLGRLAGERPDVAPKVGPVAALLALIAADIDDCVAKRLQQAEEISALLLRCRPLMQAADAAQVGTAELDAALASAPRRPGDYTLHNIENHVAGLRRALIRAHVWLESPAGAAHGDLLAELWSFLRRDAEEGGRLAPTMW